MTTQLSKAQIEALKIELGKYGLNVTVARKPKADIWEQRNNARRGKYRMWMGKPIVGVTSCFKFSRKGAYSTWGKPPKTNCPHAIAEFYKNPWINQYMPQTKLITYQPNN